MWSQTYFIEENKMDSANSRISFFRWQTLFWWLYLVFYCIFFFEFRGFLVSLYKNQTVAEISRGWDGSGGVLRAAWGKLTHELDCACQPVSTVRVLVSLGLISFTAVCHLQYIRTENPGHVYIILIENVPLGEFLYVAISKILSSICVLLTY